MKTREVQTTDGRTITEYSPENAEDVAALNKMLAEGTLDPGGGPAIPAIDRVDPKVRAAAKERADTRARRRSMKR